MTIPCVKAEREQDKFDEGSDGRTVVRAKVEELSNDVSSDITKLFCAMDEIIFQLRKINLHLSVVSDEQPLRQDVEK